MFVDLWLFNSLCIFENFPTVKELTCVTSFDLFYRLVIRWRFVSRVRNQMKAFCYGFKDVVPINLIKGFSEKELEQLMCGIQIIDVNDWRNNASYRGGYHPKHRTIQWFWRVRYRSYTYVVLL